MRPSFWISPNAAPLPTGKRWCVDSLWVCLPLTSGFLLALLLHKAALVIISVRPDLLFAPSGADLRRMALVENLHLHPEWVLALLFISFSLLLLAVRRCRPWTVWLAFGALASPVAVYGFVCMKLMVGPLITATVPL